MAFNPPPHLNNILQQFPNLFNITQICSNYLAIVRHDTLFYNNFTHIQSDIFADIYYQYLGKIVSSMYVFNRYEIRAFVYQIKEIIHKLPKAVKDVKITKRNINILTNQQLRFVEDTMNIIKNGFWNHSNQVEKNVNRLSKELDIALDVAWARRH